jgi:hypothetical protein
MTPIASLKLSRPLCAVYLTSSAPRQDASWNTDCYRIGWHILDDHGVGADHYVITYGDAAEDLGAGSNVDSITDDGGSADTGAAQANRYSVANDDVVAENRIAADNDVAEVLNFEPFADGRFGRQFDSGQNLTDRLEEFVKKRKRLSNCSGAKAVTPTSKAVNHHYPETAPQNIAFVSNPVFAKVFEHRLLTRAWADRPDRHGSRAKPA